MRSDLEFRRLVSTALPCAGLLPTAPFFDFRDLDEPLAFSSAHNCNFLIVADSTLSLKTRSKKKWQGTLQLTDGPSATTDVLVFPGQGLVQLTAAALSHYAKQGAVPTFHNWDTTDPAVRTDVRRDTNVTASGLLLVWSGNDLENCVPTSERIFLGNTARTNTKFDEVMTNLRALCDCFDSVTVLGPASPDVWNIGDSARWYERSNAFYAALPSRCTLLDPSRHYKAMSKRDGWHFLPNEHTIMLLTTVLREAMDVGMLMLALRTHQQTRTFPTMAAAPYAHSELFVEDVASWNPPSRTTSTCTTSRSRWRRTRRPARRRRRHGP